MPSQEVSRRIDRIKQALDARGFEGIYATHYDNTPARLIVLHDDGGRVAHGEDDAVARIIEEAGDLVGLWSALDASGMTRTAALARA